MLGEDLTRILRKLEVIMKFIIHQLESLAGIEIYPLISMGIFIVFFIALLVFVAKLNKNYVKDMETLPLEKDANTVEFNKSA